MNSSLEVRLQKALDGQKHIFCPKCNKNKVDVNTSDYYECRECHTQYTTTDAFADESWERVILIIDMDAPMETGVRHAIVLPDKGEGQIRFDIEIATIKKLLLP